MRAIDKFYYVLIRIATFPLLWLPDSWIHTLGKGVGFLGYYILHDYRKRALSNLAMAGYTDIVPIAKASFQNLAINCLEYPKLCRSKNYTCENPEIANELHANGQGIIFFCAHQANWELLFLDGTSRMKGVAIGKPIKNKRLYEWILQIREKNGGKIIDLKNALREGAEALNQGLFLGIISDRGMPMSTYTFPFFGRSAKLSTGPAFLAYKTNSPIIFAENRRVGSRYRIRYSEPLWPDLTKPIQEEMPRMMNLLFAQLEKSIRSAPGEWLWQHNLWKKQTPRNLFKPYRQDAVCLIVPHGFTEEVTFRSLYPKEFITLIAPEGYVPKETFDEVIHYGKSQDLYRQDYRFKVVYNFTDVPLHDHYLAMSAFAVLDLNDFKRLAEPHLQPHHTLTDIIKRAICRPGTTWRNHAC
jgi:KDO2-lipid IV(A) lauroyltransferase